MELLPELDSVVRFEGELTLAELLEYLDQPYHWGQIHNLAFRRGGLVVLNPTRPLIADLDSIPPIHRDEPRLVGPGIKTASMLASRGCLFNCSFCSIRQFYGYSKGALRRTRSPRSVAEEMSAYIQTRMCVSSPFRTTTLLLGHPPAPVVEIVPAGIGQNGIVKRDPLENFLSGR